MNSTSRTKTILFLSADPTNAARLRLGQELRDIQERLRLSRLRDQFTVVERMSARVSDITQAIFDAEPKIVHFSGHGTVSGDLVFEDNGGRAHAVTPEALATLFELFSSQVQCVVLNACFSEAQAAGIAKHINYVIGMNKELGDAAAIAFSVGFYKALGGGRDVEDAYRFGIAELKLLAIPEHLTPVLIKRPDGVKCVVAKRTSIYDKRTSESAVFQCDASRQLSSRRLLVNPAAYPSMEQLLDDIFINLLSDSVSPYTYGSEWIITSSYRRLQALVPLEWISARSSSIRGVAPSWGKSVSPSDQGIEPGSRWEILLKSGATLNDFTSFVEQAALFGFATNNLETVHALRDNIKAAWQVGHDRGFTRQSLDTLDHSKYRFRCVFADSIRAGLGGQILVELA